MSLSGLAARAAALPLEDVPETTRSHAAAVVADTIGVMVAGARRPEIEAFLSTGDPLFPPVPDGPASILTPDAPGTTPQLAAFINATAGTFLELDEGIRPTGHPGIHVIPAALATAQALNASGADLLAAVLSGYEATARLFTAYALRYPLHPHGNLGAVGAAIAVARLRGAPAGPPATIAATLPLLSVWTPCFEGATVRNAYTGTAAAVGILANRLAVAEFTGSEGAQQTAFDGLVGDLVDPAALTDAVDPSDLAIDRDYIKFHSACALTHTAIDALLELGPLASESIDRIEVETVENNLKLARLAEPNELSMRFSLPHALAAAAVHGHAGPSAFVPDERVSALAERVEVRAALDLQETWPESSPARVAVHTGGDRLVARVDNPRGHHSRPVGPAELREKFETLVAPSNGEGAHYDHERLLAIEEIADSADLFERVG